MWWQKVKGKDPQSEGTIDHWSCAVVWNNTLLIENSQLVNQAVASIQSTRNVMSDGLAGIIDAMDNRRERG